jgi:hypothetical protein
MDKALAPYCQLPLLRLRRTFVKGFLWKVVSVMFDLGCGGFIGCFSVYLILVLIFFPQACARVVFLFVGHEFMV